MAVGLRRLALAAVLVFAPSPLLAAASDDEEALELEVVFSTRTDVVTPTKTIEVQVESPFAVSTVAREDLALLGALSLPDGLRTVPGVLVLDLGGGDVNLAVRGGARQFDERVVYLVDGRIASSEAFGVLLWPTVGVPLALVDQVEILRGAGSPIHGQNALSGVVQVRTRTPADLLGRRDRMVELSLRAGDTGIAAGTLVGAARGPWGSSYRLTLDADHIDPYTAALPGEASRVWGSARWDIPLSPATDLRFDVGAARARHRFAGTAAVYLNDPVRNAYARLWLEHERGDGGGTLSLSWNHLDTELELLSERVPAVGVLANPDALDPSLPAHPIVVYPDVAGDGLVATGGAGPDLVPHPQLGRRPTATLDVFDAEAYGTIRAGTHAFTAGALLRFAAADSSELFDPSLQVVASAFAQEQWRPTGGVELTVGGRFDVNSDVASRASPRVAVAVRPGGGWTLRASAGLSFHDPSAIDLHLRAPAGTPLFVQTPGGLSTIPPGTPEGAVFPGSPANPERGLIGDPELDAETLATAEVGARGRFGAFEVDATVFAQRLEDGIRFDPTTYRKANQMDVDSVGIEASGWLRLGDRLRANLSTTLQEVTDASMGGAAATPSAIVAGAVVVGLGSVLLAPSFTWRSAIEYDVPPPLTLIAPRSILAGDGFDVLEPGATAEVPSRFELGAVATWQPRDDVEVGLVGRNLLGSDSPDFPQMAAGDLLGVRMAEARPRLVFVTLRINY